ncbi:FtsX-like permease family protein [Mycetocola lacteus]|uniref:FtsX-like permease family protein n=1 Tax=Mycetocola lacteus TaxID=76637 RepID=A0A3L7AWH0_9MICO|nr:FtsX-like permease family protein [Mycetocola lacteus]RLP80759.1 FtsX-like permease family protein [Mycetocola lacteus]RLP84544.1 FtsX-like permease family protein [Mycetocola lacteus]
MIGLVAREAYVSAKSQPVATAITLLMVIGMILSVMLTTGRTIGAEQQVLSSIDAEGTRSIIIRAEDGSGLTSDVLERVRGISGIEWAGAFSSAVDATNAEIPDGERVPVRYFYGDNPTHLGFPTDALLTENLAYASSLALDQLGLSDVAGAVKLTTGESLGMAGVISPPDYLAGFEPLVVVPRPLSSDGERVNIVVVFASQPELVAPVSSAIVSVLGVEDPSKITVQTSEALAQLRSLVQGQLGSFSRGLVLAMLALMGALVAILLFGLVVMRRKDFGRRRALGATRGLIIALLLLQTGIVACLGIVVGILASVLILIASGAPLPGISFIAALGILTLTTTLVAALIPALLASRREPIRELRVP